MQFFWLVKMVSIGTNSFNRRIDAFKADVTIPTPELFVAFDKNESVKLCKIIKYHLDRNITDAEIRAN